MNAFGVIFFSVCFVSVWLSFWAIAEMRWVRRESVVGFICRGRIIGRRMLYEFYIKIKMLATNVELAHE